MEALIGEIGSWPFKLLEGSVAQQGLRHCPSQAGASPYGARRWLFPLAPVYNGTLARPRQIMLHSPQSAGGSVAIYGDTEIVIFRTRR